MVDDYKIFAQFIPVASPINKNIINYKYRIVFSKINPDALLLKASIKERLYWGRKYIYALFHEVEHYKDFKRLLSGIPSLNSLRFAYDYALMAFNHGIYSNNHDSFYIESFADSVGYERLSLLLDTYTIDSIKNCTVSKLNMYLSDIKESEYNCRVYDIDDYLNDKMDYIVKNHREFLSWFPILLKKYYPNGSKKSLCVLYKNMVSDLCMINTYKISDKDKQFLLNDMYNMYYYLMYHKLCLGNTKEIKDLINLIGYENFVNLINQIRESYRQREYILAI